MAFGFLLAFCDVTAQAGLMGVSFVRSVALVDYDGDGDLDIIVGSSEDGATKFFKNVGGKFTDATAQESRGTLPGVLGLLAWDLDYDGAVEIAAASSHLGSPPVFLKKKAGVFQDVSPEMGFTGGRSTRRLLPVDVDCNDQLELLEINTALINEPGHRLWVPSSGGFVEGTPPPLAQLSADGFSGLVVDLNLDTYPDIILSHKDQGILVIKGRKDDMGRVFYRAGTSETRGIMVGDYNGDGLYDILVCSDEGALLLANRSGEFRDITAEAGLSGLPPLRDGVFCDVDLDGWDDILLVTMDGALRLMINEDSLLVDRTSAWGLDAVSGVRTLALGDYDDDGDPDIALVADGSLRLLENITARGNYIKLRLKGPDPVDRITIYSENFKKMIQPGASINSLSHGAGDLIFGVGERSQADSVVIVWACGGGKKTIKNPKIGSLLTVSSKRVRSSEAQVSLPDTSIKLIPNPAFGSAGILYLIEKPSWAELRVVEPSGKTVRVLDRGQMEPGAYWVTWDGTDETGRLMPRGIYFVNLAVGEAVCQKKLVWFPY
ncbi:MAG: FG-GAP-like repeat-containing protein [candidate division WOR-3 bacterium]